MSDAKTLLKEFLGNIGNPEKAAALFAEDGVFEMPFFVSLGLPTGFNGLWASRASPPSWTTTRLRVQRRGHHHPHRHPDQVFAEYVTHATAAATGRRAHHLFMGHLVAPRTARSRCCARP